ncbi:MAG: hypothetical protein KDA21_10390 [Phycisphaerales bacterium]|nr:hypothetical protein [Phycisphaerales bacterium]
MSGAPDSGPAERREEPRSFGREVAEGVREGLVEEVGTWLKWAAAGALLGALLLGGFTFLKFGLVVGAIGAAIGLVVGGIGAWLFYLWASTF